LTTDHVPSGFDSGRPAGTFVAIAKNVLLRPAAFFAAASGEASYAGPIIYALACRVLAVLAAGAYDLTFASVAGTLDDISVIRNEARPDISYYISEGLEERQAARDEAADRASQLLEQWSKMHEGYYRAFTEVYGAG
jgi:hypothetical protein